MKIAIFDAHRFEKNILESALQQPGRTLLFLEPRLDPQSALLAQGCEVVCSFVNDCLNEDTLEKLHAGGTRLIALRSAGFNHVNLEKAKALGLTIVRVPAYSPYAVAEHAVALLMTLNRKIHRAYSRVREFNFSLEGLVGFDLHGKTVAILGTGRIGLVAATIFRGFGCKVLAFDKFPNAAAAIELGFTYATLPEIYKQADVISLHLPLTPDTKHLINSAAFAQMKKDVFLINTGRGALIDTHALVTALKEKRLGGAGLDVYELEEGIFFNDLSAAGLDDDQLARLLTFPNVVITSHQAFLTHEALTNIAEQTALNIEAFLHGTPINQV